MRFIYLKAVPLVFVFVLIILFIPESASAQLVECDGVEVKCDTCQFVQLGQNILNFLVKIGVTIAAIGFAIGGYYMVTSAGDTSKVGKARQIFTNVVIGLIILIAAWLIIDTVMKALVNEKKLEGYGPWNAFTCGGTTTSGAGQGSPAGGGGHPGGAGSGGTGSSGGGGGGGGTGSDDDPLEIDVGGGALAHDDAVDLLTSEGIIVTSTNGPQNVYADCGGNGCTSLDGILEQTLSAPREIKNVCPTCDVQVTAGTESGHADGDCSHGSGCKIDIDDTPSVQSFLESNLTRDGSRDGYPRYVDATGNEWVDEGSHWDAQLKYGPARFEQYIES